MYFLDEHPDIPILNPDQVILTHDLIMHFSNSEYFDFVCNLRTVQW